MKFARFLKYLVDNKRYRLTDLSEKSGIHNSDLSKIINGKRVCGVRTAAPIIGSLDQEHQATALVNWLLDQIPAQFTNMVHVVKADPSSKRDEQDDLSTLEGSVIVLARNAENNDALRAALMSMARAFAPS